MKKSIILALLLFACGRDESQESDVQMAGSDDITFPVPVPPIEVPPIWMPDPIGDHGDDDDDDDVRRCDRDDFEKIVYRYSLECSHSRYSRHGRQQLNCRRRVGKAKRNQYEHFKISVSNKKGHR